MPRRQALNPTAYYTKDLALFRLKVCYTSNESTWEDTPCCYCGMPATTSDHVYPLAALRKLRTVSMPTLPPDLLRIVPACLECNKLAQGDIFPSWEDKRAYIKTQLRKRYKAVLNMPTWTSADLEGMQGDMQAWLQQTEDLRATLAARLQY